MDIYGLPTEIEVAVKRSEVRILKVWRGRILEEDEDNRCSQTIRGQDTERQHYSLPKPPTSDELQSNDPRSGY